GIAPLQAVQVDAVSVLPVELDHGGSRVYGYRVGRAAYLTDVKMVSDAAYSALEGVDVLVINALFERPHPTHLSFDEAVEVARRVGARRTFITHLTHRYAHAWLETRLPEGIAPAYDGLVVPF
ncbi:MAG: MBL fold metallo-hydrolase, partial [Gemmatimonadota bacterium]|nr:MBL fold metallo-hydrolase [Gemmatimonadota bacterium]